VLTEPSRERWLRGVGAGNTIALVPGAVDAEIPAPGADPFGDAHPRRCLFAGNIYDPASQPEAHATLVGKLNGLGRLLGARGIRLYFMGPGERRGIDAAHVTTIGAVPYERSWSYLPHAHVGLVLALGPQPNENESTKIYHYLRVGLPTVCEAGFPNQDLVRAAQLGHVVANGDLPGLADAVEATLRSAWDRQGAVEFVLARHTWRHRALVYDALIRAAGM
jgi:hypothetical protein